MLIMKSYSPVAKSMAQAPDYTSKQLLTGRLTAYSDHDVTTWL
jgi:hypothetical protein